MSEAHALWRLLAAIDLQLYKFKAEYKGQIELYRAMVGMLRTRVGRDATLGLILCAGKLARK